MQKLAISKKIMDIHNQVPRGQSENYTDENITGKYNIPNDF